MKSGNLRYRMFLICIYFVCIVLLTSPPVSAGGTYLPDGGIHLPSISGGMTQLTSPSQFTSYSGPKLSGFTIRQYLAHLAECSHGGPNFDCGIIFADISQSPQSGTPWFKAIYWGDGSSPLVCNIFPTDRDCVSNGHFHYYTTAGTFPVTLKYQGSLNDPITTQSRSVTFLPKQVIIQPPTQPVPTPVPQPPVTLPPEASFYINTLDSMYSPISATFVDTSSGTNIVSRQWDFGDGTRFSGPYPPTHVYTTRAGESYSNYNIRLTVTDNRGRTSTYSSDIYVMTVFHPDFNTVLDPPSGIAPLSVTFTDVTPDLPRWGIIYWDFGDGSSEYWRTEDDGHWWKQSPHVQLQEPKTTQHVYTAQGAYLATMTVRFSSDFAGFSKTQTITVGGISDKIHADFIATPQTIKSGEPVQFTDTSTINTFPTSTISEWHWDFGDGTYSTERNPAHTYQRTGPKTVKLTVGNGLTYSDTKTADISVEGDGPHVESIEVTPNSVLMYQLYAINIKVHNPDDEEKSVTIYCHESGKPEYFLFDEKSTNGPAAKDKTITIPAQGIVTYSFEYQHNWRWLKPIEDQ